MLRKFTKLNLFRQNIFKMALAIAIFLALPALSFAQTDKNAQNADNQQAVVENKAQTAENNTQNNTTAVLVPVLKDYKEISIGMPGNEVRDKLGKPELNDKNSFFYRFSDAETAQILLDSDSKVRIISVMYLDKNGMAPKPADVFGNGVEITPNEEGALYKVVRYPEAGYILVYSRSVGENPMVIVTMQKM